MVKNQKALRRNKIRRRIRSTVTGTSERLRLAVFKSSKHIYAQCIDDVSGVTVVSASTAAKDLQEAAVGKTGVEKAVLVGDAIARKALEKGIQNIVFDRSGYKYHGKIKALADAAREAGLNF